MGKKRIIKKSGDAAGAKTPAFAASRSKKAKRKLSSGLVYISSTYNNTVITFTDEQGNAVFQGSAGALGFSGARKGTPFAAARVAGLLAERSKNIGLSEIGVFVKGVGSGRESAIRSLASAGLAITFVRDITPLPHNGPRPPKPRRV